jgi:hypothetical protein
MARIKLKNGASINHGQLSIPQHLRPERAGRSAPPGFGRFDGKPKAHTIKEPEVAYGMVHQGADRKTLSDFHHGIPTLDEPMTTKPHLQGRAVPIHNGMGSETPEHRGADYGSEHGSKILTDAGRLGAPVGGYKK